MCVCVCRVPCFLGPVPHDGLPKDAKAGCSMRGALKLAKTSPLAGDKAAPNSVTLLYTVPPAKKKADEDSKDTGEEAPLEALKHARRDADVRPACAVGTSMRAWHSGEMYGGLLSGYRAALQVHTSHGAVGAGGRCRTHSMASVWGARVGGSHHVAVVKALCGLVLRVVWTSAEDAPHAACMCLSLPAAPASV